MASTNSLSFFFNKLEAHYQITDASINKLLALNIKFHPTTMELNFLIRLIAVFHFNFSGDNKETAKLLAELLKGGHLKFTDNGSFYTELVALFHSQLRKRNSTHSSAYQQYALFGPVIKEVLIGVSEDEHGNKSTWLQFEKHSTETLIELILHLFDYIKHKFTGKNIGPYGLSDHTENNPLKIQIKSTS